MENVRVRIAPSPSGFLHIGTAKIALINWLFARQRAGTFVLRLEDTDPDRTEEQYVEAMCEGFSWLGIDWDEGPPFGGVPERGPYAPYRQSQRAQIHRDAAARLLASGHAYKCFCSKEDLDAERARAQAGKLPWKYSGKCRALNAEQIAAKRDAAASLRFKTPQSGHTVLNDLVQGPVRWDNQQIDDFIILKSNGDPIFHLAVVVDDLTMKITHVIRGDDHLTNAAKHVLLFEALGGPMPQFAHVPMVLDETGKKYSKRMHGANVLEWREDGYLPEALINYVVLLGWTAGDDKEVYTRAELVRAFSLERLGRSAAKFDLKKLQWLNGQHIRKLSAEELRDRVLPILNRAGLDTSSKDPAWLTRMAAICQEKLTTLNDIVKQTDFFFVEPSQYEEKAVQKQWKDPEAIVRLETIERTLREAKEWTTAALHADFERLGEAQGGMGKVVHPLRLALTGKSVGPGLFELAELLGKDACLRRVAQAVEFVRAGCARQVG